MSLNAILSSASKSLQVQELELQVTNNNIANASTTGYAREVVNLSEASPTQSGSVTVGNGVDVSSVTSVRDELLTMRIQQQTSTQSASDAQVSALSQIQTLFPSSGTSLSSSLSSFFTSLSALSANPSDTANRQTVMSSAQTVVQQFHTISAGLSSPGSALNTDVQTDVTQLNQLSTQAASLNQQIMQQKAAGQSSSSLDDQLNQVESSMASLTGISVTHGADGDSITTGNGTPLVLGVNSYALQTGKDSSGNTTVLDSSGTDITSTLNSGDLGGTITVRNTQIPALTSALDTLANQFATAYNTAQTQGYDQNGNKGAALFTVPATVAGSAAGISLATTDATTIAASSDGSSGSNGNVANLTAVQNATGSGTASITSQSANLVYQVGNMVSTATAQSSAVKLSLSALNEQQSSVSGVSVDEESANLVKFQQAYQAAAKVISIIQTLFDTTVGMLST